MFNLPILNTEFKLTENTIGPTIIFFIFGYLIGSFLISVLVSKYLYQVNIYEKGSKNPGATNMARVIGFIPSLAVFIFDSGKGILVLGIGVLLIQHISWFKETILVVGALGTILGHCYPIYFKFKGGKGAATLAGSLAFLNFYFVPIIFGLLIIFHFFSKYASLTNLLTTGIAVILTIAPIVGRSIWIDRNVNIGPWYLDTIILLFTYFLVIYRHKNNLLRIYKKTENISKIHTIMWNQLENLSKYLSN